MPCCGRLQGPPIQPISAALLAVHVVHPSALLSGSSSAHRRHRSFPSFSSGSYKAERKRYVMKNIRLTKQNNKYMDVRLQMSVCRCPSWPASATPTSSSTRTDGSTRGPPCASSQVTAKEVTCKKLFSLHFASSSPCVCFSGRLTCWFANIQLIL